jgi:AAA15 family ATPase/GTPase
MLKQLQLTNFTQFKQADFEFSEGLNLIIGENGLGKTHLLKLGYLVCKVTSYSSTQKNSLNADMLSINVAGHLMELFKAEKIGNLSCSAGKKNTIIEAQVVSFEEKSTISKKNEANWSFGFSASSETYAGITKMPDFQNQEYGRTVYLPSKEMLSFFEGFIALYQKRELAFDETFYDLAINLSLPALKERPEIINKLLADLSAAVGGEVMLKGGRFYIATAEKNREVTLLAEGLRKLATVMQLLSNGSLATGDTLFWDEPEANLNPKLIKLIAFLMHTLSENGIQVIAATHSYFLLKELDLLSRRDGKIEPRYISLIMDNDTLVIEQESQLNQLDNIVALDEELSQYDREMELSHARG